MVETRAQRSSSLLIQVVGDLKGPQAKKVSRSCWRTGAPCLTIGIARAKWSAPFPSARPQIQNYAYGARRSSRLVCRVPAWGFSRSHRRAVPTPQKRKHQRSCRTRCGAAIRTYAAERQPFEAPFSRYSPLRSLPPNENRRPAIKSDTREVRICDMGCSRARRG
jgi:hypothetical protein